MRIVVIGGGGVIWCGMAVLLLIIIIMPMMKIIIIITITIITNVKRNHNTKHQQLPIKIPKQSSLYPLINNLITQQDNRSSP